jgi:hypothetical protein
MGFGERQPAVETAGYFLTPRMGLGAAAAKRPSQRRPIFCGETMNRLVELCVRDTTVMKPKFLLCFTLVLSGGLFGCLMRRL